MSNERSALIASSSRTFLVWSLIVCSAILRFFSSWARRNQTPIQSQWVRQKSWKPITMKVLLEPHSFKDSDTFGHGHSLHPTHPHFPSATYCNDSIHLLCHLNQLEFLAAPDPPQQDHLVSELRGMVLYRKRMCISVCRVRSMPMPEGRYC